MISCSFGYLAESEQLEDGTRLLTKVDLFEVTLTPSPMNPGARVISYKGGQPPVPEGSERLAEFYVEEEIEAEKAAAVAAKSLRESKPPQVATFSVDA